MLPGVDAGSRPGGDAGPPPARSLWRNRGFLLLWSAETVSIAGSAVGAVALPLVAIVALAASPWEVSLLGTVEMLPFILFSLPAGAWIDRVRRRPVLIAGDLGRALLLGTIPLAAFAGLLGMGWLYVVGFLVGTLTVLFDIAYQSFLPSLVGRGQILDANGKLETSRTVAQTGGPALGGTLAGWLGAPAAVALDALSFLASGLLVLAIGDRERPHDRAGGTHTAAADATPEHVPAARPGLRREVADGLRYVLGSPWLRPIATCTATTNLLGQIAFSTYLVYLVRDLGLDAGTIGLVIGLGSLGGVVGATLTGRIGARLGIGRTLVVACLAGAAGGILVPLAPRDLALPLLIASGILTGFSAVVYNVTQVSFRQAITPEAMLGRMNATMRFLVWGTIPVGALIGGALATAIGVHAALWIGTVGGFLPVLAIVASPVRALRSMPDRAAG